MTGKKDSQPGKSGASADMRQTAARMHSRKESESLPSPDAESESNFIGKVILVVEDDPMIQQLLEIVISGTGATVIKAFDGAEAIRLFRENRIDMVLLDKRLPEMDGFKILEEMKLINPDVPVIGQSAHIMHSEREQGLKLGMAEFISKPFDMKQMHRIFTKYLTNKRV